MWSIFEVNLWFPGLTACWKQLERAAHGNYIPFDLTGKFVTLYPLHVMGFCMEVMSNFFRGMFNTVKVAGASMLYRHPYRISAEGLRADWANIGKDIDSVFGKLEKDKFHE